MLSFLLHFLDNRLTNGGKVVRITHRPPFTPQEDSWYSFMLGAESTPRAIERLEGWKKSTSSGLEPATLPQPTTLPRDPQRLTTLWASMACYRDSFTFTFFIPTTELLNFKAERVDFLFCIRETPASIPILEPTHPYYPPSTIANNRRYIKGLK
jgi:hypothetical protein